MVIFDKAEDAYRTEKAIKMFKSRECLRGELKFNKTREDVKDRFFQDIVKHPFHIRALVVIKKLIYSTRLKSNKEAFHSYFVKSLLNYDDGALRDAKVVIDSLGDRAFRDELAAYLRRHVGSKLKAIAFSKSHTDDLLQLADMCAGAIARAHRKDRKHAGRWRSIIRPRINDEWVFR